jgi:predicted XRE-type DNA-binding protein
MDWKTLIENLTAKGWKQQQIAEFCGCQQSVISELATGKTKNPRFSTGQALIAMGRRKVPADRVVA